jgi:hypothetical protein
MTAPSYRCPTSAAGNFEFRIAKFEIKSKIGTRIDQVAVTPLWREAERIAVEYGLVASWQDTERQTRFTKRHETARMKISIRGLLRVILVAPGKAWLLERAEKESYVIGHGWLRK